MTTDSKATYYDLSINGTTVETRDIIRAVLERAGLGADASHQLGKLLERAIRLGAKPGTDITREVEKIHIEAGMLRDAASPDEHRGLTADDARKWRGLRARIAELERELDEAQSDHARAQVHINELCLEITPLRSQAAQAERERDEWEKRSRGAEADLSEFVRQKQEAVKERDRLDRVAKSWHDIADKAGDRIGELLRERDEAREDAAKAKHVYNDLFDSAKKEMETLKEQLSAARERGDPEVAVIERLRAQVCAMARERDEWRQVADDLDKTVYELTDRHRPRRQSEEPAPHGVPVLSWSHSEKKCGLGVWLWRMGEDVAQDGTWTHQPLAPERLGE